MKTKMQCKDIPTKPILEFLNKLNGTWATLHYGFTNSITNAMPPNIPFNLKLAKMKILIKKGYVIGCTCGCRGDFEITDEGVEFLFKDESFDEWAKRLDLNK